MNFDINKLQARGKAGYLVTELDSILKSHGLSTSGLKTQKIKTLLDFNEKTDGEFDISKIGGGLSKTQISSFGPKHFGKVPFKENINIRSDSDDFADVSCGISTAEGNYVKDLVCANLSSTTPYEYFKDAAGCTTYGDRIAGNIIRVASKRIFADPYRSFVEPISNSVDSYREMRGVRSIGKFGMGFFSLLYWLQRDEDQVTIESTYKTDDNKWCSWKVIIYLEGEDYVFVPVVSEISSTKRTTGTRVIITTQAQVEDVDPSKEFRYRYSEFLFNFYNRLVTAFGEVPDVKIDFEHNIIREYAMPVKHKMLLNPSSKNAKDVAKINLFTNEKEQDISIYFTDEAGGIPLSVLFGKLLVPSISTKTLDKFESREAGELDSYILHDENFSILRDEYDYGYRVLLLTVGGIGLVSFKIMINRSNAIARVVTPNRKNIKKYVDSMKRTYVWSLPSNSPMPVSRDDVVYDDNNFYDVARNQLILLVEKIIKGNEGLECFLELMKKYAEYAQDNNVNLLIDEIYEYLENNDKIYLIPKEQEDFYVNVVQPNIKKDIIFVGYHMPDYPRVNQLLMDNFSTEDGVINNKFLIFVSGVKEQTNEFFSEGGTQDFIFVDANYHKEIKDSGKRMEKIQQELVLTSTVNVYTDEIKDDDDELNEYYEEIKKWLPDPRYPGRTTIISDLTYRYMKNMGPILISYVRSQDSSEVTYFGILKTYAYFLDKLYSEYPDDYAIINGIYYNNILRILTRNVEYSNDKYKFIIDEISEVFDTALLEADENRKEKYRKYYIDYVSTFSDPIFSDKRSKIEIFDFSFNCILSSVEFVDNYDDYNAPREYKFKMLIELVDYVVGKSPSYGSIFNYLKFDFFDIIIDIFNKKSNLKLDYFLNYIYKELTTKYSLDFVRQASIKAFMKDDKDLDSITNELQGSLKIVRKVQTGDIPSYDVSLYADPHKYKYQFKASQLIDYLFEYNPKSQLDLGFLKGVSKFKKKHSSTLQSLEIAINDGTSKPFMDSVITELTQNSVDATRSYIRIELPKKDEYICENPIEDRAEIYSKEEGETMKFTFTMEEAKKSKSFPKEGVPYCPNIIDLKIGKIIVKDEEAYGISMTDHIGIPTKGLLSLMIPFLSTKSSDDQLSTGEMGSGFMNVFRQPYCDKVIIETRNATSGRMYKITGIPEVVMRANKRRVVDIDYTVEIDNAVMSEVYRQTTISVLLRKDTLGSISSMLADANIFAYKFYAPLQADAYVNERLAQIEYKEIVSTSNATILWAPDGGKTESVILTNGVPFGSLRDYIFDLGLDKSYNTFGFYGLALDIKKSSYQPTQSRKRISFDKEIQEEINEMILYAIIYKIVQVSVSDLPYSIYPKFTHNVSLFEGANYKGSPDQVRPKYKLDKYADIEDKSRRILAADFPKLGLQSMGSVINDLIDMNLPQDKRLYKDIMEPYVEKLKYDINGMYKKVVYAWFYKKKIRSEAKAAMGNDKKKKEEVVKIVKVDNRIVSFVADIIGQVWNTIYTESRRKGSDMEALKPRKDVPGLVINEVLPPTLKGFYDPVDHTIHLNPEIYNLKGMKESISKLKKNFEVSELKGLATFRTDTNLQKLMGIKANAVTLIHEFGHAIRGASHTNGGHAEFIIGSRGYSFDAGCNEIWRRGLEGYRPRF
jgi:hypothetical protein